MLTSTVTKRGQTTIPKEIRLALDLDDGSKLLYELHGDQIIIRTQRSIRDFAGCLKPVPSQRGKLNWEKVNRQAQQDRATKTT